MADIDGLEELHDLSEGFEEFSDRGQGSMQATIANTLPRLFEEEVVPATRRRARDYVGEYAGTIEGYAGGWHGDDFTYGLGSDSVVVESHEYGSGQYNIESVGEASDEFGRRAGYRIPAESDDGPIAITVGGREQVVEYVVHPGVKPKGFMHRAVAEKSDDVASGISDDVAEALERQLDI